MNFGIVIMTETRDSVILTGGNWEMSLWRNLDSGIPETEICKESQAVILAHLINIGNSQTMT